MPPITQQGSRTGLITAVVIFVVLFVTAAIFAIYYGVDANRTHLELETYKQTIVPKYIPSDLGEPSLDRLDQIRQANKYNTNPSMPLLTVASTISDELKNEIKPGLPDPGSAIDQSKAAVADSSAKLKAAGVTLNATEPLLPAFTTLTNQILAKQTQIKTLQDQLTAAQTEAKQAKDQFAAEQEKMAKTIEDARAQATKQEQEAAADRQAKQASFAEIEANRQKDRGTLQEELTNTSTQLRAKQAESDRLNKQLADVRNRLTSKRISTNEPILRHPDGTILRVPGNNIVYISRGSNDQIVPGMTFEVYDKNPGIPKVTTDTDEDTLPQGKASIEVIRVNPTSSECRITRVTAGSISLQEGDIITNLVYDPQVKYRFFIPKDARFDLDHNGVATAKDAEVIRRLITQWGGILQDKINVDTDFVILGREPVVPNLSPDDEKDPLRLQERSKAEAELAAYQDVVNKSHELHIPVLNQNRFLYLIGYYDQASQVAR